MEKKNKPKDHDLVQQRLKAFQPTFTLESTIGVLVGCALLFFVFGLVLYSQADKVAEFKLRYPPRGKEKESCNSTVCNITIHISGDITPPVYIYYELDNFYQNHRKFMRSRSYKQLMGHDLEKSRLGECDGMLEGRDLPEEYRHYVNGSRIGDEDVLNPCGLMARTMFNDTFELYHQSGERISINESLIAWESDIQYLFNHTKDWESKQWLDVEDEHFIVWMRVAVTRNFRKMWGRLNFNETLSGGDYNVVIRNNYDVSKWRGRKYFVITNANPLGGKNYFLGMIFIFTAILCLFASLFFCGRAMISKKGSVSVDQLAW